MITAAVKPHIRTMDVHTQLAITSITTGVSTVLVAWIAYKTAMLGRAVEKVHLATNSMKDALVEATAKASRAEGVTAGKLEEKAEAANLPRP